MSNFNINTPQIARVTKQERSKRDQRIVDLYLSGKSGVDIGLEYGMTRANVSRIVLINGVKFNDSRRLKTQSQKEKVAIEMNDKCIAKYGFSKEYVKQFQKSGITRAYRYQKNSAKARGIVWNVSFYEWVNIWVDSGKFGLRGVGHGKYCMSRRGDVGDYSKENVFIQLSTQNNRDAAAKWAGKKKENRGVFHLYPGLSHPWEARYMEVSLGFFVTEQAAVIARNLRISTDMTCKPDSDVRKCRHSN